MPLRAGLPLGAKVLVRADPAAPHRKSARQPRASSEESSVRLAEAGAAGSRYELKILVSNERKEPAHRRPSAAPGEPIVLPKDIGNIF